MFLAQNDPACSKADLPASQINYLYDSFHTDTPQLVQCAVLPKM